ncbi:MAG: DUF839 domain-containing protein [Rhodospirillales bacterium]|nr:DUF839 domain-containing protein [Rhodospirillales bacterium]
MISRNASSIVAVLLLIGGTANASGIGPVNVPVPTANPRDGVQFNRISPDLAKTLVAKGADPLENPSGLITRFGFLNNGAVTADQIAKGAAAATPTEPDKNTYLELARNPGGPVSGYDYGRHFLFQGHENDGDIAYVTRINLDVDDPSHRITLVTPVGPDGLTHFNAIDGSTWDPFTKTLLFTQEDGGAVLQIPATWPPRLAALDGILGTTGFEGIQVDPAGNLYLAEDIGGSKIHVDPGDPNSAKAARQPNAFMYRFLPYDKTNLLKGGKLQALQVSVDGSPITFHADDPEADVFSQAQLLLHTPYTSWPIAWVLVHDTGVLDSAAAQPAGFDANQMAKDAGATPFKRPENFQFQPGTNFRKLYFDETGDTDVNSGNVLALAQRGAWGSIFELNVARNKISLFVLGDAEHNSFDNLAFADPTTLLAEEDRGDSLHEQLNTLDSMWGYSVTGEPTVRWLALGRDPVSVLLGDNEPTGIHVSNGKPGIGNMFGRASGLDGARAFFTQQHGMNEVWEIFYR